MYTICYWLGKINKTFRFFYHKKFNNYPWGVIKFIEDNNGNITIKGETPIDGIGSNHLTKEKFEEFIRETFK